MAGISVAAVTEAIAAHNASKCDPPKKNPCKGLREQLQKRMDKLAQYKNDPDSMDNQDILKNNPDKRDEIIESRIRKLQRQIDNFKKQLEACEKKNKLK
jgi:hypothetical protein